MVGSLLCPVVDWCDLVGEALHCGKTVRVRVRGWSMHPAIRDGDVVWIASAKVEHLRLGQVLLYSNAAGKPLIHRFIRRGCPTRDPFLCIASDRVPGIAEWVPTTQILGRVVGLERSDRRIALDGLWGRLWGWAFLLLRPLRPLLGRLRGWMRRLGGRARRA